MIESAVGVTLIAAGATNYLGWAPVSIALGGVLVVGNLIILWWRRRGSSG